ncbi:hypothetical protein [Pseudobacteriovorax antillogorgiicola]|uniref:Uncharacterized protein n=1 Tax=Pseudobacteriovorax antillogorgiicola TaxID=1513793 RepID=A0A1Y6BSM6_9BACT|nr:hypothetical protein [Pseudobacteriovorax antillogorgiicola]TCS54717.1 hypothetical protein EDD56_106230 [Pseudobacteriovorax antillogorgiicola]SMF16059.1 hypothetical protein SAMN06296036_10613 [Pseudobacteriovorax antillogorgiicola]
MNRAYRFAYLLLPTIIMTSSVEAKILSERNDLELEKTWNEEDPRFESTASLQARKDPIFIAGIKYSFDERDFVNRWGREYELTIPVSGDSGENQLIFDIEAAVEGNGFYNDGFECHKYYPQPGGMVLIGSGYPPDCHRMTVNPRNQFKFIVNIDVKCSGIPIGNESDDKNSLLSSQEVREIKETMERWISQGRYIFDSVIDRHRSINLIVDNELNTGGDCESLTVKISGRSGTTISKIDLDVTISERF